MPHAKKKTWLVTGGAGFIGSCFILQCFEKKLGHRILNLDKLTYSGNPANLAAVQEHPDYRFIHGDIGDAALLRSIFESERPDAVLNFAAESHVDRSILDAGAFVSTNVAGTCVLLSEALAFWRQSPQERQNAFRFLHISTDEVFGSLGPADPPFTEKTPYAPNSPYAASKAASDHFVRAFAQTHSLPAIITNCSNNYGPRQFPEKLIPLIVLNAMAGKILPIYGSGKNIRDWLHVEDHCAALLLVLEKGIPHQTYNIGGHSEESNINVVNRICSILDELSPRPQGQYKTLIRYVSDRPGHDLRYAIDCGKIEQELGWKPTHDFSTGLKATVLWYMRNQDWIDSIQTGEYRNWLNINYGSRT